MALATKTALPGRYLSFSLGKEIYAVPIGSVWEINGITEITEVPQTFPFVKGVLNLRGKVIPVIDLRLKFGMQELPYGKQTCVIIMDTRSMQIGVIVDTVNEVLDLLKEDIEPKPDLGNPIKTHFISGMGKFQNHLLILLNIDRVLSIDELTDLNRSHNPYPRAS